MYCCGGNHESVRAWPVLSTISLQPMCGFLQDLHGYSTGTGKSFVIFGVFELIFAGVKLCLKTLFNTLSPDPINGFWQNLIHNTVDS